MCEEQRVFRPVGGWLLVLALGKQAGEGTGYGEGHAAQGHGQSRHPVDAGLGQGGHGAVRGGILHTIQTTAADLIDRIEEQIRKAEPEDSGQETSDVAGDYFEIYQLKENMENRQFYFMDLSFWQSRGLPVEHTRYDVTYTASLDEKTTLDDIYCRFNIDRPSDFFGHSLSVSDVVVLHRKGKTDSYFVDNIGFQPVTDFFKKEPKDVAV